MGMGDAQAGWDFFVSYTQADAAWAEWIAWVLEEDGHRVLIQAWDFVAGDNWVQRMREGVAGAARTVAILSTDYLESEFGTAEWEAAWRADPLGARRKLLTVKVADCEWPDLLASVVGIELFEITEAEARRRLLRMAAGAEGGRVKPDMAPPFPGAKRAVPDKPVFPPALPRVWKVPARPDVGAAEAPRRPSASGIQLADRVEGYLTGVANTSLYWQGWLPVIPATGVLLLCHGGNEHCGRYQNVVDTLIPDRWAVYGLDLRGHGRSGGKRVHVDRFSDWLDDFDRFKCEVVSRHQGLPVFVLGHCLGAQIALAYALDHQEDLRGLVLSAPFLDTPAVPGAVRSLGKVASRLLPEARFKVVGLDRISQDPEVVRRFRNDPLVCHENATMTMARIVERQFKILIERSRDLRIPVLIQHGAEDAIADPDGSRRLARAVGSPDCKLILYPGLWNEIYNEPERQRPLSDLHEWLASHRESPGNGDGLTSGEDIKRRP